MFPLLILSLFIFTILLTLTSIIKTQTRIIEKNIFKVQNNIAIIKSNLHESQLEFDYLSSPEILTKNINTQIDNDYIPMKFSNIYLSYKNYLNQNNKTTLKINNEKKFKKK